MVVAVVVVRWPAEPMQQEVKDWEGEGITLNPRGGHGEGSGWALGGFPTSWRDGKRSCAVFRRCPSA